jgi:hypothetical protein
VSGLRAVCSHGGGGGGDGEQDAEHVITMLKVKGDEDASTCILAAIVTVFATIGFVSSLNGSLRYYLLPFIASPFI